MYNAFPLERRRKLEVSCSFLVFLKTQSHKKRKKEILISSHFLLGAGGVFAYSSTVQDKFFTVCLKLYTIH